MKATLEYNLPEDATDHLRAVQANHAWTALYDIDYMLRNLLKHGDGRYKTVEELATAIRSEARYALDKIEE
jgi:phosphoribosylformylglycinamidine (FGAM) synthase-like amidotransferase family enzyme